MHENWNCFPIFPFLENPNVGIYFTAGINNDHILQKESSGWAKSQVSVFDFIIFYVASF